MKTIGKILGVLVLLAAVGAGVLALDPPLRDKARVKVLVIGLETGVVPVDKADWGFLKLRAGQAGTQGLRALMASKRSDVARTAYAVRRQWHARGERFFDGNTDVVADRETQYGELVLPADIESLPRDLAPGESIPASFLKAKRFNIPPFCDPHAPASPDKTVCRLRVGDMDGDGNAEVIVTVTEVLGPDVDRGTAFDEEWQVFSHEGEAWPHAARYSICGLDHAAYATPPVIEKRTSDIPVINGDAISFYSLPCGFDNQVETRQAQAGERTMAARLAAVRVLYPAGATLPASFRSAMAAGAVDLGANTEPYSGEATYTGLPHCFVAQAPARCRAIVADLDHDGVDEVVIFDTQVDPDGKPYHLATLFEMKDGRWRTVVSHAVCASAVSDFDRATIALRPGRWRLLRIGNRETVPVLKDDTCWYHGFSL